MQDNVLILASIQDNNWEDDGGDHDPILLSVTPEQLDLIQTTDSFETESEEFDELMKCLVVEHDWPVTIHWYGTIWTC